jgi:hypothetical protein
MILWSRGDCYRMVEQEYSKMDQQDFEKLNIITVEM